MNESNLIECSVCFDMTTTIITCSKKNSCLGMCLDCMTENLNIFLKDETLPKCENCKTSYYFSDISNYPNLINIYTECCLLNLVKQKGEKIHKHIEIDNRIDQLRNNRKVFIKDRFPIAILFTAQKIMPELLIKLDKQQIEHVKETTKKSKRICMNSTCNGFLDENFICMTCETIFCKTCEKIKLDNHQCAQEDIDSIQEINSGSVRCPSCNLPVFRSSGCDLMRCSHCDTNFRYSTGEIGGGGNSHNSKINEQKDKYSLSKAYKEYLEEKNLYDKIIYLENINIREPSSTLIDKLLIKYYENNTLSERDKVLLAKNFEKYMIRENKYKIYKKSFIEMEQLIMSNKLNDEHLNALLCKVEN